MKSLTFLAFTSAAAGIQIQTGAQRVRQNLYTIFDLDNDGVLNKNVLGDQVNIFYDSFSDDEWDSFHLPSGFRKDAFINKIFNTIGPNIFVWGTKTLNEYAGGDSATFE